MKVTNPRRNK